MLDGITPNATGSIFGWDFQINAAILLFLREPDKITKLRVEGAKEDIEIYKGNQVTFAQCKSISKAGDYSNVSKNYNKALETLNRAISTTPNCENLIFVTNTDKPLGADKNIFGGFTWMDYAELPPASAKKIQDVIKKNKLTSIDTAKLKVCVIPFISNDFKTRYRCISETVNDFLNRIDIDSACGEELMMVWQQMLLHNATQSPEDICLSKEDMVWPLIVILMEKSNCDWLNDEMDDALQDAATRKYKKLISVCENKINLCFKVLYAYEGFGPTMNAGEKMKNFVLEKWTDYVDEIANDIQSAEEREMVTKIILYRILRRRIDIDKIKSAVNMR